MIRLSALLLFSIITGLESAVTPENLTITNIEVIENATIPQDYQTNLSEGDTAENFTYYGLTFSEIPKPVVNYMSNQNNRANQIDDDLLIRIRFRNALVMLLRRINTIIEMKVLKLRIRKTRTASPNPPITENVTGV
ncbi:hypothetical protein RF11_08977 [Thelohanellus kitauei]|uniref:Uncharacterized protein n=1 Tax=Thelohanellus kitauei TaxID=669202 RepID=A0A0C2MME0_THEKT|nr:hypothetical protein RF11_08977 [Thelohanellus kitauei]